MNESLYQKVVAVLENVQLNISSSQKFQVVLINLYKNSDIHEFYACFEKILSIILNKDPKLKNVYVERVIEFCMAFCNAVQGAPDGHSFFELVLNFLLEYHNNESNVVRFRVCQCVNRMLVNLTDEEMSEDLCSRIEDAMLERLEVDNRADIRYQAVCGVYRLQDALNVNCKVIPKLLEHMETDQSWKVRNICAEKIHIKRDVMVGLVQRTRDVNSSVRLTAYKRLSKLVKVLKISERHSVILNGFLDGTKSNTDYVSAHLIPSWFDLYDNDYLQLVHSLRLDFNEKEVAESTKVVEYVLSSLFKNQPLEEATKALAIGKSRVVPIENLNWEITIYWRFLVNALRKSDNFESLLEEILPELVNFAAYIRDFITTARVSSEFPFILNELFTITRGFDVSDTVSRDVLTKLVLNTLQNVDLLPSVVITVVDNLKGTVSNLDNRIMILNELISDIVYPPLEINENANDFRVAELKVTLYELEEKLRTAVQREDYDSAARYKEEINQTKFQFDDLQKTIAASASTQVRKNTDVSAIIRSLNIARATLLFSEITASNLVLRTLNDETIMEFLGHEDLAVRDKALECFALYCLVDRQCAEKGFQIFISCILANEITPTNNTSSLIISIKAVCDLFILYGQDLLDFPQDSSTVSPSQVVQSLVYLMEDDDSELKECATRGLCNLILHGRIQSSMLVSRMIIKWCNPVLGNDNESERVRQLIGLMLEELPALPGSADTLENAILPTIKTIVKAPKSSPLADVNLQCLIKFMLSLCSICTENDSLHNNLALKFCVDIKDNKDQWVNIILSKSLLLLEMKFDRQFISGLDIICDDILDEEDNRTILKNIEKFKFNLKTLHNSTEMLIVQEEIEE